MAKKSSKSFSPRNNQFIPSDAEEIIIPDEAIYYIVSRYLQGRNKEGDVPVVVGISTNTVEDVLQLFIDWAAQSGYIKDGMLTIGGHKIDG